jgi:hypothetical protein
VPKLGQDPEQRTEKKHDQEHAAGKEGATPNRKPQITAELLDPCISFHGSAAAMNRSVQFQGHRQVHGQVVAFQLDAEAEHQQSAKQDQRDDSHPPRCVEDKPDEGCDGPLANCFHQAVTSLSINNIIEYR